MKPQLVDTHCHIHHGDYGFDITAVVERAVATGVTKMICIGVEAADSQAAIDVAAKYDCCWASVGLHPHDADELAVQSDLLRSLVKQPKVVAVGECGLDYFRNQLDKSKQEKALRFQIELALEFDLPLIIHIRDAYHDFWPVFDDYRDTRGVAHCFAAGQRELDQILDRGLYVALNGIMTFSQDQKQLAAAQRVPLDRLLLETDAPFLTPRAQRGKINEPKYIEEIAKFLAQLRQEELGMLQKTTTDNAINLFKLREQNIEQQSERQ